MKKIIAAIIIFFAISNFSYAQSVRSASTEVQLVSETLSIQPGKPFSIALNMKLDPHWHVYWFNPGDSGYAPHIKWQLPEGFKAGDIQWPYPKRLDYEVLTSYGYDGDLLLASPFSAPAGLKDGETITIKASVEWLACENICVPGKANLSLTIPVRDDVPQNDPTWQSLFAETRAQYPAKTDRWLVKAVNTTADIILHITTKDKNPHDVGEISFFPYRNDVIQHAAAQKAFSYPNGYELIVPKSEVFNAEIRALEGTLVSEKGWEGAGSFKAMEFNVPLEEQSESKPAMAAPRSDTGNTMTVLIACLFAFVGGLILNLMPCVLPVLAIKVLGLIQHAYRREEAWRQGFVFVLGVLTTFWVLAFLLIVLKATGQEIGWGFQFQSPVFVLSITSVLFLVALNLFGVFEVGMALTGIGNVSSKQKGYAGSYISGALAVIVATPCTAPFMGAALGFALAQSTPVIILIFTFLGLGLASPYFLCTLFPKLLKFIPKPGRWMVMLKIFFGFLMMATVVWLCWVYGQQSGSASLNLLFVVLLLLSLAGWLIGVSERAKKGSSRKITIILILLCFLLVGIVGKVSIEKVQTPNKIVSAEEIGWQPYSPELLEKLKRERRRVFLDFTAAWCLTCQVNEQFVFHNTEVIEKIRALDIVMVKADWTNQDPMITKALAAYGKSSIPLYVLLAPGKEPVLLPELITPHLVIRKLDEVFKR